MRDTVGIIGNRGDGCRRDHCLLDAGGDVGDADDAHDMRLSAQPFEKFRQFALISRIIDAVVAPCPDVEFDDVETGQMVFGEIAVLTVLKAAVEVAGKIIIERDALNPEARRHHDHAAQDKETDVGAVDEATKEHHRALGAAGGGRKVHADEKRGQPSEGEDIGKGDADGDHVAEVAEGRRFGEVHRQEADGAGEIGERDRPDVNGHRLCDGIAFGQALPEKGHGGGDDAHGGGHVDRYDDDGGRDAGGIDDIAEPARDAHSRGARQDKQRDDGKAWADRAHEHDHHQARHDEADRDEQQRVADGGFGEGAEQHDIAGELDVDVGMFGFDFVGERTAGSNDLADLCGAFFGQIEIDEDTGGAGVGCDQAVDDEIVGERDGFNLGSAGGRDGARVGHQFLDRETVGV